MVPLNLNPRIRGELEKIITVPGDVATAPEKPLPRRHPENNRETPRIPWRTAGAKAATLQESGLTSQPERFC